MYTTIKQAAELFNVTEITIRRWIEEFSETGKLSPAATPQQGRRRVLTDSDMEVIALVAEMKGQGKTFEDIHAALKAGQRGELPQSYSSELSTTSANTELLFAVQRIQKLELELEEERAQRREAEIERGRAEGRLDIMRENLDRAYKELEELRKKLQN